MPEELNRKADHLSLLYKTKYSEDRTLKDMLSRPKDFVEGAIEGIINLLRQKAWRDGYIAGATEAKEIIKELVKNSPDTYSGTNIELQQKKMFAFQNAVNKVEAFLKE